MSDYAGAPGLFAITAGILMVSCVISAVVGANGHWLPMILGLIVGWWAVAAINS